MSDLNREVSTCYSATSICFGDSEVEVVEVTIEVEDVFC